MGTPATLVYRFGLPFRARLAPGERETASGQAGYPVLYEDSPAKLLTAPGTSVTVKGYSPLCPIRWTTQGGRVMAVPCWLKRILDHHAMPYEEHHHPAVYSAPQLAEAEHISGYRVAKTVLLAADGLPVAVVLPANAQVDLARVQALLSSRDLRLATEAEIAGWFKGCHPGAVPPLRLRSDEWVLMDRSMASLGQILFAAGTPKDAVTVRFHDWYRAVRPGVGRFTLATNGHARPPAPPTVL